MAPYSLPNAYPFSLSSHCRDLRLPLPPLSPVASPNSRHSRTLLITSFIRRQREVSFDDYIQRQKKVNLVCRIKDILVNEPGMVMPVRHLSAYRRKLGFDDTDKRKMGFLIMRYPTVFEVFMEGADELYFGLTKEAKNLFTEEQKLQVEQEAILVTKIRKLLMMSVDKMLLLYKISHLKRDLGLPDDFKTEMIFKYPQYFKVIETEAGTALELTSWDPELAISAYERKQIMEPKQKHLKPANLKLPKGYLLKRKEKEILKRLQDMSYLSPYSDIHNLEPCSRRAEKHSCAVVHEILSLTLEKRIVIDYITHLKKDYKFSLKLQTMLIRHPELFYVSSKGGRDCVFLRDAYNESGVIDKDPLVLVKEKLGELIEQGARKSQAEREHEFEDESRGMDNGEQQHEESSSSNRKMRGESDYSSEDENEHSQPKSRSSVSTQETRKLLIPSTNARNEQVTATLVRVLERW